MESCRVKREKQKQEAHFQTDPDSLEIHVLSEATAQQQSLCTRPDSWHGNITPACGAGRVILNPAVLMCCWNSLQSSELQTSDPAPLHCHADGVRDHPRANGRVEVSALRRPDNRFSHWTGKNISLWTVSLCCFLKREKQNCWHKTESRLFSKVILHI